MKKLIIGLPLLAILAACGSHSPKTSPNAGAHIAATAAIPGFTQPPLPPDGAQVARLIGASGYADCGPSPLGGVADSGVAKYRGEKIGIDTFATLKVRNGWLQTAQNLGVEARWEASTWVAYKALDQEGGCQSSASPSASPPPPPSPSPSPLRVVQQAWCKVLLTGSGGEEFEIWGATGTMTVSFSDGTGYHMFSPETVDVTSDSEWFNVPAADIGASAEPTTCSASQG